jgi:hypothetical protein
MNEYNTDREHLILKEYGRNIQKLVDYLSTIEDKAKRTEYAHTMIELMKQLTPAHKDNAESPQKMWDDLYIISDFKLDIDGPYPKPEREVLERKPDKVGYQSNNIKYKHYGMNIELLIKKAIEMEDAEEREAAIVYIGKLMKSFYSTWNKDFVEDDVLVKQINQMSGGVLNIDIEKVKDGNLFESLYKEKKKTFKQNTGQGRQNRQSGGRQNSNRRRRN